MPAPLFHVVGEVEEVESPVRVIVSVGMLIDPALAALPSLGVLVVLAVVLFASALFFAGISTRLRSPTTRVVILGMGCALFLGSVIWIATFPVSLSV